MSAEKTCYRLDRLRWYEPMPASPAVRAGDLLFVAGQVSLGPDFSVVARGDVRAQARHALDSIAEIVEAAGGSLDDVIDVVSFHVDPRDIDAVLDVARDYFAPDFPAWTPAGFLGSYVSGILVSIRAIAHLGSGRKECFTPDSLGWLRSYPASGGCKKGNLVFVSGQVAADADGAVLEPGDHTAQARHAYDRIREILQLAGGTVDDVLDFSSFHQDIRGAEATLLDVYIPEVVGRQNFAHAASTSHIGTPGLQKLGLLGSYRALADLSPGKRIASTPSSIWWKEVYPIAGGAKKEGGGLITVAGQVASGPNGSVVAPGDIPGQARYVLDCMREALEGFGASMEDVVEVSSFHKDPRAWKIVMDVGKDYFGTEDGPAWTPVGVPGLWVEGFLHEVSALAVV